MTSRQPTALKKKPRKKRKIPTNKKYGKRFAVLRSRAAAILARNVRRLRKELKISQAELGARIGTDQAAIGLLELARANPTLLTLESLAQALKSTVPDLLTKAARNRT